MKISAVGSVLLGSVLAAAALAEDEPAKAAAPAGATFADIVLNSGISESGYVAAAYYASNSYNTYHQFDSDHNSFELQQAAVTLAYQPKEGFGAVVNVAAGEDMKMLNSAEGNNANTFDIIQGFMQYAHGVLTVMGGKYVTLAGAEVIAPTGNTQFSRSFLFYAEPLTHTGVRATYAITDTFSIIGGVNSGWNSTYQTTSGAVTGEAGIAWTPNKTFALTVQGYVGNNNNNSGANPNLDAQRAFVDAVATYNATADLTFVLSFDYGKQDQHFSGEPSLSWNGAAFYSNYALNDQCHVGLRVEYLDDRDGFATGAGVAQTLKEGTVTFAYDPVKSFELRLEVRYDTSTVPSFVRVLGEPENQNPLANNQSEVALQGVYKF